ncbi:MAG: signal peptide peptidase SppA [Bacteroidaceae bacterium]|nr:signal peptide peptidase SppA [Bacteroidaceae bacterium]
MKQFLKYVLATIVGVIIVGLIMAFFSVMTLVGMASMSSSGGSVSDNSVLVLKLEGAIQERAEANPFAKLFGSSFDEQGLDKILTAIKHAETEDKVKGIYIEAGTLEGAEPATLQAIRDQLEAFKKSGKFIVSYGDTYSQGAYYLSSVADSVIINPQGMIEWSGLGSEVMYYKDLLDKIGVKMQVFKVGTYKSAVEPYILSEMSEANREQITTYLGEVWKEMLDDVSKSRKISNDALNAYADSMIMLNDPSVYKKYKLVDKYAYSDEVPQIIANMMKVDSKKDYNTVDVNTLATIVNSEPKGTSGNIVAVYYAYGEIVEAPSTTSFSQEHSIIGKEAIKDLERLANDDDIKAVVLRVNSPGGSAYASEQIWHQVMNIKSKKPIIVSMGGLAASGGYYISCAADWIVAEPTTLTGSIGIFGMITDASELINNKLGVHLHNVGTNLHSDFGTMSRPFNASESALMQNYVNRGYELFTKRCADGRKMKQDDIKKIAEGRVWTGVHAKQLGLVDQLGSLDDAISVAKKKAKIDECTIVNYPGESSMFENLMNEVGGDSYADAKLKEALGDYYGIFTSAKDINRKTGIQASLPYYIMFNL